MNTKYKKLESSCNPTILILFVMSVSLGFTENIYKIFSIQVLHSEKLSKHKIPVKPFLK